MVREIEFRDFIGSKGRKINNKFLSFVRYGFELAANIPQGLWIRGYKSVINEMKSHGYNTIRLTFSNQMLRPESVVSGVNYALNADLVGLSPLQCMDKIINSVSSQMTTDDIDILYKFRYTLTENKKAIIKYLEEKLFQLGVRV
jgi:hypothetical protein